ncbi:MAG: DUF3881 family protein [Lachnospiraceae bacterium]|nr:DUF3881 family protein [Lachnospiraceae bacterium]
MGYSEIEQQGQVEELLIKIVKETKDRQFIRKRNGIILAEYRAKLSDSLGICVCGEEDKEGKFHMMYYFPYCTNVLYSDEEFVVYDKKIFGEGYTGMCDDEAIGATLIFYVTNVVDYMFKHNGENTVDDMSVAFSALSNKGNIILPTVVRDDRKDWAQKKGKKKKIADNDENENDDDTDEKEMVSISLEEIEKFAAINERSKKEDILSIVESSLVPLGSESDVYILVGTIIGAHTESNIYTGEEVYILLVDMNSIYINVAINKKDLYGEPVIGRRFRGNVWLQGKTVETKFIP